METSKYYRNMLVYDMPSVYDISDFGGFVDPPPLHSGENQNVASKN